MRNLWKCRNSPTTTPRNRWTGIWSISRTPKKSRLHFGEILLPPPTEIATGLKLPSPTDIPIRQIKKTAWRSRQNLKRWLGLPASAMSNPSEKDHFSQTDVDNRVKRWKTVLNL